MKDTKEYEVIICNENPFKPMNIMQSGHRSLKVKAHNEDRVRELWEGVKDLPQYAGMRIKTVKLVRENSHDSLDA